MSSRTEQKPVRWPYLLVAFLLAAGLWYTLNAKDQVERMVEVRLDYRGLPPDLVVTSGQLNKVSVRVRGPIELLRAGSREDPSYTIDLSGMTPGDNVVPFAWEAAPTRAFEVLETIPPRMILHVEYLRETVVPVSVRLRSSPLTPSLRIADLSVRPPVATVRGPASAVDPIKEIAAEIPADARSADGEILVEDVPLLAPAGVEITPQMVRVRLTLAVQRRTVTLHRELASEEKTVLVRPSRCVLTVSVPASLAQDEEYLSQFQAALPPDADLPEPGSPTETALQLSSPPNGRILRVDPESVTLVRRAAKRSGK